MQGRGAAALVRAVAWLPLCLAGAEAREERLPPGDFQYFLPQEFLLDLPIRNGSFAGEVMRTIQNLDFQDVHAQEVDEGVIDDVFATSDLNAPAYKASRKICTKVPPGYNRHDDPSLCESEGATAPQILINPATPGVAYSEGNFQIAAEFDILLRGYLHVWTQTCVVVCWENQLCHDDITLSGSFRVESSVEVMRNPVNGQITLWPRTQFKFTDGPYTNGCREDWVARFFANVDDEISGAVGTLVQKWVNEHLQKQIQMNQVVQLMPGLSMAYQVVRLDFVPDQGASGERGFVRVHALTTVTATAPNGTVQQFPDERHAWTGSHNTVPLQTRWQRRAEREGSETVLLGGVRFSQEMLTMLFQGMHYAGFLSPHDTSTVHDAKVLSHVDMLQPAVHIEAGGQGALLVEPSLSIGVACPDRSDKPGSGLFRLLDATFSGVMQRVIVSAFVAEDHSAMGLLLQLSDISLSATNMTAFSSSTFLGSEGHFKAMAERVLRTAMPKVNRRLAAAPIVFCGGSGGSCALVPFVPHPEVKAVSGADAGGAGFVQLSWACSCSSGGLYQQCQGFLCPAAAGEEVAQQERRLRGAAPSSASRPEDAGLGSLPGAASEQPDSTFGASQAAEDSNGTVYLSTYAAGPGAAAATCAFDTLGSSLRFGALRASLGCVPAPAGSRDLLGSAYRLERLEGGRFILHTGCELRCSDPCQHATAAVRLHECGALVAVGPGAERVPFMLSLVSAGGAVPSPRSSGAAVPAAAPAQPGAVEGCVGGHEAYGPADALLLGLPAGAAGSGTPITHAVHLSRAGEGRPTCVPCGAGGRLWCRAELPEGSQNLRAWLLCRGCSGGIPTGCLLGGSSDAVALEAKTGVWFGVPGNASGYSRVALVTQRSLPVMQPCPRPPSEQAASPPMLPVVLAGVSSIAALGGLVSFVLLIKGRGWCAAPPSLAVPCKACEQLAAWGRRAVPRIQLLHPGDALQNRVHGLLWAGSALLLACGLVWFLANPLVSLLLQVRATTDARGDFNGAFAEVIVERSRFIGLAIFSVFSALLAALSLSMLVSVDWPWLRQLCGEETEALIDIEPPRSRSKEKTRTPSRTPSKDVTRTPSRTPSKDGTRTPSRTPSKEQSASRSRSKETPRSRGRSKERASAPPPKPLWPLDRWFATAAFLLSESNSGIAFLAFCLWRDAEGDLRLLGGDSYAGETATAVFSIRLLLAWIAPFLLVTHSVPAATLGAYARGLASVGPRFSLERRRLASGSQPFALASVLVNASIELVLSIVYYRSGYGTVLVLYLMLAGVVLNLLTFLAVSPQREGKAEEGDAGACSALLDGEYFGMTVVVWILTALQFAGTCAMLVCLADRGSCPFLVGSWVTAFYLAWASAQVFMESTSVKFEDDVPMTPTHGVTMIRNMSVAESDTTDASPSEKSPKSPTVRGIQSSVEPRHFCAWLLEKKEERDRARFGARIKWRRLCLLMGSSSLVVSASKVIMHNMTFSAWDDVNTFLEALAGEGVLITRDQASVFEPLVERYGRARTHHAACILVGAGLFAAGAAVDAFSAGSPRSLKTCRLCGFLGTIAYLMGMLIGNMPDYVGMLDFTPTLGRCGSDFCNAVAASMRAAFGAALLAQSGAMFIPVLVSLPWTLGRIGFFLLADSANTRAVAALTWGTITCMLRLSILPATVAFVYRPVAEVAAWYVVFLLAPSVFLIWIVVTRRTNLVWYLLWGWAFFLVPLLAMGSIATKEGMWPLWWRIYRNLFSEDNWPNSLAEFTLSDVVISDMFFMIL